VARASLLLLLLAACAAPPKAGNDSGEGAKEPERPLGHAGRPEQPSDAIRDYLDKYGYGREDFEPVPDRWRIRFPQWKRMPDTSGFDSPFETGRWSDPFSQNVWKGDYPIAGQHTFFVFTATSDTILEARKLPTPAGVSTARPGSFPFFGTGDQLFATTFLALSFELFHGNTAFKPPEWFVRITPVFNVNYTRAKENNNLNIDPGEGATRTDGHIGLQEAFFEVHLADLSDNYDFLSTTIGIQRFVADPRGFLFFDNNLGARLSANLDNNRWQANLAAFYQLEKDTNSELNTFQTRDQALLFLTLSRQDFVFLGYTLSGQFAYNHDEGSIHYDQNGFPVRPPVIGDAEPHEIDAFYLGFSGDGHLGRLNITHQYFYVFGKDSNNPVAGRPVDISAHMFFIEVSVDMDWWRPRASFLFASGDDNPTDSTARGFDSILDNPNFAGGMNSYWIRQGLRLLGVGLVHRLSAFPSLRSSKIEGQSNFVNPGILFFTLGADVQFTQELFGSLNVSYLRFDKTGSLEPFVNQNSIAKEIGLEVTFATVYRPLLTNNIQLAGGLSFFLPGAGFEDLYEDQGTLLSFFVQLTLVY